MRVLIVAALALALSGCSRADPEHGRRIAAITGCISCHGPNLDGHLFEEDPNFAIAWSSNLSRILPKWSDDQIAATIRTGRRPDGTPLWFMPTFVHRQIDDTDMRDLIAWLRSVPPTGTDHPPIRRGPQFAMALKQGMQAAPDEAARLAARSAPEIAGHERGRYLTILACAACHGPDLKGPKIKDPGAAPDLSVAAAYSPADFAPLLKTGRRADGSPAGFMAEEVPKRLTALTPDEVTAIHGYLKARAAR